MDMQNMEQSRNSLNRLTNAIAELETVRPKAFSSQFAFDAAQAHPRIYQDSGAYAAVFFLSQEITVAAAPAGE